MKISVDTIKMVDFPASYVSWQGKQIYKINHPDHPAATFGELDLFNGDLPGTPKDMGPPYGKLPILFPYL